MKYLLVVVVVAVVLWLMFGLGRKSSGQDGPPPGAGGKSGKTGKGGRGGKPAAMVACAHCGVHLPQAEATADAAGRLYCSDAHRLAGPV